MTNGGWAPIGQIDNEKFGRTYSTVMALWALIEARKSSQLIEIMDTRYDDNIKGGIRWLLSNYNYDLRSWVPNPERAKQIERFPGLTAQTLYVLELARPEFNFLLKSNSTYDAGRQAFFNSIEGDDLQATPALASRLASNNDRTHDSDRYLPGTKFTVEGSTFLWFPWTIALCAQSQLGEDVETTTEEIAKRGCSRLLGRINNLVKFAREDPFTYVMAESLFALRLQLVTMSR